MSRGKEVLDLCCGTGDMTFALYRRLKGAEGADRRGGFFGGNAGACRKKVKSVGRNIRWVEADALNMTFSAGQFQLVTSAFGFRNLANYDRGLMEIYRVLAPDGEVGILDFGDPKGLVGKLYRVYFRGVLPAIGTLISGVSGPLRLSAGVGTTLSISGGNVAANASGRLPRGQMDALHVWDSGTVSGEEVRCEGVLLRQQEQTGKSDGKG